MREMYETLRTLQVERDGRVLTVRLNRPEQLNAIDALLHTDLTRFFEAVRSDTDVDVLLLSGAGTAFSAGGDLNWFKQMTPPELERLFDEARRLVYAFISIEQPIVAMVRGPAVGLGATLALMSDFVVAAEDAVFADPHVRIGVVAGDGGAAVWPLLCGLAHAKRFLMLGDRLDAREAERLGLVGYVVAPDELEERTHELVRRLADGPRQAIRGTKRALNKHLEQAVAQTLDVSLALERGCFDTSDHREAVAAFLERRTPQFDGSERDRR